MIRTDVWSPITTGILQAYNYIAMNGNISFWVAFYHEQSNRIARDLNINVRGTDEYSQRRKTACCRGRPPRSQNTHETTDPMKCDIRLIFVKLNLKI